jgi:hypothetical protein
MARAKRSEGKFTRPKAVSVKPPLQESSPPPPKAAGSETVSSRKTRFAKEIVAIGKKGGIAPIAKHFVKDGVDEIQATRIALRLLEAEQYVLAELGRSGDIESGLTKCKEAWDIRDRHEKTNAYTFVIDSSGNRLPVPLEKGLAFLMPREKKTLRLPRFREWLCDDYTKRLDAEIRALLEEEDVPTRLKAFPLRIEKLTEQNELSKDPQKVSIKADSRIREMQENGIPTEVFDRAGHEFSDWWSRRKSESKKAAGKLGVKKRKRVARPPFDELKKLRTGPL